MNPVGAAKSSRITPASQYVKLIKSLFLDELWKEFECIKDNRNKLQDFHQRLSRLKFLDPACGFSNILVITYANFGCWRWKFCVLGSTGAAQF